MASRLNLQTALQTALGTTNVYFQPPSSLRMSYPAIVYSLDRVEVQHADDLSYLMTNKYMVTLIHKDPDNIIVQGLLSAFPMIRLDRTYMADGLYHYVYTLYY